MQATAIICADGVVTTTGVADRVPWWSFTKTVLAVATLRLVENGSVDLDEKLPGEPFTARQLLRHEAGLPDYGSIPRYHADVASGVRPWAMDQLLEAVDVGRLRYQPGAGWAYSNVGYLRIRQLIERTVGSDLASALASLVFQTARLDSARLALGPADLGDVRMGGVSGYHPGWVYHGLVVGTVADAARLLWQLAHGDLLGPTSLAAMKRRRPLPEHRSDAHPDPAYGLGLMLAADRPDAHPMGHSGAGPGSRIAVYAQTRRVAAVWAASASTVDPDEAVRALLGSCGTPGRV
jgi:CubicO group peptidase (beta-lactamase class C family)